MPPGVRTTVIVPTLNEATNLPELVRRVRATAPECEILIVDDASPDRTATRALTLGVRVIERTHERGLASAITLGLEAARTDVCVVMDADLSHPPEQIPDLVHAVEDGADVAVGSRYVQAGSTSGWPLLRRLMSTAGTLLSRPLTPVRDPLAGFFCLRRSLLESVQLKPRGFKLLLEILARVRPARVVEVPIRFQDRHVGTSKFDHHQQWEYLVQLWTLYRDLNAWPLRLAKFLATAITGLAVPLVVLTLPVKHLGSWPLHAAPVALLVGITWNYTLNRFWTFRARRAPLVASYLLYTLGTLGELGVRLVTIHALAHVHDALAAALGILAGTLVNYTAAELLAFRKR